MSLLQEINTADSEQITESETVTVTKYVIRNKESGAYIQNVGGGMPKLEYARLFPSLSTAKGHISKLSDGWEIKQVEVTIKEK